MLEQQELEILMKRLPEIELLRSRLALDVETGVLTWLRVPEDGKRTTKSWNSRYAGRIAGHYQDRGYKSLRIGNKPFLAHRIVFFMAFGIDPYGFDIDHIDGDTSNNSPSNLRMVSHSENLFNRKGPSSNSTTGIRNIYKSKTRNGVFVSFVKNKTRVWIGSFEDINSAKEALDNHLQN